MLVAMLDQCYHQHASGSSPLACQWQAATSMTFCTCKKNCATLNNFACRPLSPILQPAIKWDNDINVYFVREAIKKTLKKSALQSDSLRQMTGNKVVATFLSLSISSYICSLCCKCFSQNSCCQKIIAAQTWAILHLAYIEMSTIGGPPNNCQINRLTIILMEIII